MPRYKIYVDETVNRISCVDIEADSNVREIDATITKIEKHKVISALSLKRELEAQGIVVKGISLGSKPYYLEAKAVEIEELEEPQNQDFTIKCKACDLSKESIEQAIEELREKMYASINQNERQADATIQVSQDLDVLIVSHMRMQLEGR